MNLKTTLTLSAGIILGYSANLLLTDTNSSSSNLDPIGSTVSKAEFDKQSRELTALIASESLLKKQLTKLKTNAVPIAKKRSGNTQILTNSYDIATDMKNDNLAKLPQSIFQLNLDKALQSLDSGDTAKANSLFNLALNEAKSYAEREIAIDGLLAVHRNHYDKLIDERVHLHGAVWTLFEMHKLRPSEELRSSIISLSGEALSRAERLREEGDFLGSTDHLNTLMHVSKMMSYEVTNEAGEKVNSGELAAKAKEIEGQADYFDRLSQRAEQNLLSGNDFERSIVFWDYTKLAELGGEEIWQQSAFVEQFTQASLEHLSYLKSMNQTGEVKSRLDFIRYAFPPLMKDQRLYDFH